jgi:hypothetical protein
MGNLMYLYMHLHQYQHVTFTAGKNTLLKVCELKSVNAKEFTANDIIFSQCKINYTPMFYVFNNIIFYVVE